jgi:AAHS family 4-hydroxybenzoate transporter-like MFS transporter
VLDTVPELEAERRDQSDPTVVGVLDRSNLRLNVGVGISFTAAALVAYAMLSWTTTMLTAQGFNFEEAAYAVSVGGITSVIASIAAGFIAQWIGTRLLVLGISGTLLASLLWLGFTVETMPAVPPADTQLLVISLVGLVAAIFSAGMATMYAIMTHAYPPSCRSAGIGFGIFMGRVGAVAATALGGWLLDLGHGSVVPFFTVVCAGAVLFSAAAFIVDRHVPAARPVG